MGAANIKQLKISQPVAFYSEARLPIGRARPFLYMACTLRIFIRSGFLAVIFLFTKQNIHLKDKR